MLGVAPAPKPGAGHPLWHFYLPAVAAVAVYVGLRLSEHRQAAPATKPRRAPRRFVAGVAAASATAAAVHGRVAPSHFREATAFGVFFVVAACLQAGWAVVVLRQPSRTVLLSGVLGNAAVITVWALSRTVGVPFGPDAWRPESISALDLTATILELGVVIGGLMLASPRPSRRSSAGLHRRPSTV